MSYRTDIQNGPSQDNCYKAKGRIHFSYNGTLGILLEHRGSRNFRQGGGGGGPGKSDRKALTFFFSSQLMTTFFSFIFVLSLFYRRQMVTFQRNCHFSRYRRRPTFSRGVQLLPGGSNCLFPIETHVTCDFPGGGPDLLSPLDPHLLRHYIRAGQSFLHLS